MACFTRPEMKVERVSYPVMTPSAARGLLEAVLWKPALSWRIERIRVLAPVRWIAFRRNEVATVAARPTKALVEEGGAPPHYIADDNRAQRNTVALRDVDYVIEARFELTERAGPGDNVAKFVDMFERRVARGQCFHRPYLGCREFAAAFEPVDPEAVEPVDWSEDLGIMLWDIDFRPEGNRPVFFAARVEDGVLHVPEDPAASFASMGGAS